MKRPEPWRGASAPRRILVGVDGSAASASAARAAAELVAPGGTLQLARVVSNSALRRLSDWLRSGGLTAAALAQRELLARQSLAALADALRPETPARLELDVGYGDVADELLRLACERGAELLVIGAPRPGRPGRLATRLARSRLPTLVVPAGGDLRGAALAPPVDTMVAYAAWRGDVALR